MLFLKRGKKISIYLQECLSILTFGFWCQCHHEFILDFCSVLCVFWRLIFYRSKDSRTLLTMSSESHVDNCVIIELTSFWVMTSFMSENVTVVTTQNCCTICCHKPIYKIMSKILINCPFFLIQDSSIKRCSVRYNYDTKKWDFFCDNIRPKFFTCLRRM